MTSKEKSIGSKISFPPAPNLHKQTYYHRQTSRIKLRLGIFYTFSITATTWLKKSWPKPQLYEQINMLITAIPLLWYWSKKYKMLYNLAQAWQSLPQQLARCRRSPNHPLVHLPVRTKGKSPKARNTKDATTKPECNPWVKQKKIVFRCEN